MSTATATWACWREATHPVTNTLWGWPQCARCGAAPQYHERGRYLYEDLTLTIFVPNGETPAVLGLEPRTALVGIVDETHVDVYYEGWKHGAAQYEGRDARGKWEAGVQHAADRMVTAYPTSARAFMGTTHLTPVGTYRPSTDTIEVFDEEALESWLSN